MLKNVEKKLEKLTKELRILKKELLSQKSTKTINVKGKLIKWQKLGDLISSKWDNVQQLKK